MDTNSEPEELNQAGPMAIFRTLAIITMNSPYQDSPVDSVVVTRCSVKYCTNDIAPKVHELGMK
jgi:hypothetical protein